MRAAVAGTLLRALAGVALAGLCACSAIVSPSDELRCDISGGGDPCPSGTFCIDGVCIAPINGTCVVGATERCNGDDDDCDGLIDETHDGDGDLVTWCGGGVPELRDCDDNDPSVHPEDSTLGVSAAPEVCDGKDNDCNGTADDGVGLCAEDQACSDGRCVIPDCTLAEFACPSSMICDTSTLPPQCILGEQCTTASCPTGVCDEVTHTCVDPQPLWAPCNTDTECESMLCVDATALRVSSTKRGRCGRTCCTNSECGGGNVCWVSGSGARSCAPGAMVGITPADPTVCEHSSECSGMTCGLQVLSDYGSRTQLATLICRSSAGAGTAGAICDTATDCASGICIEHPLEGPLCTNACRSAADCPDGFCGYVIVDRATGDDDFFQACVNIPASWERGLASGETCIANSDCEDFYCYRGRCANTCCSDAQCPPTLRCRPLAVSRHWETRCAP